MSKHTPGPWHEGIAGNFRVYAPDGLGAESGPIAEAMHRADPAIRRANARLIAAAPELVAALKYYVECEDSGLENDELDAFSAKARAAIAKAEQ